VAQKNGTLNVNLKETYRSYAYIYLPGIVRALPGGLLCHLPHVGRKYTMFISSSLMGASIFIFSAVNSRVSYIGLNSMEYFFRSLFNSVLYGWTPDAYPAPIRGTACGVASFLGRLFGILSPLIAQHLYARSGADGKADIDAVLI